MNEQGKQASKFLNQLKGWFLSIYSLDHLITILASKCKAYQLIRISLKEFIYDSPTTPWKRVEKLLKHRACYGRRHEVLSTRLSLWLHIWKSACLVVVLSVVACMSWSKNATHQVASNPSGHLWRSPRFVSETWTSKGILLWQAEQLSSRITTKFSMILPSIALLSWWVELQGSSNRCAYTQTPRSSLSSLQDLKVVIWSLHIISSRLLRGVEWSFRYTS